MKTNFNKPSVSTSHEITGANLQTIVATAQPVDSEPRQQTGHTPGPWKIEYEEATTGQFVICNDQNQYVCHGEPWIERLASQGLLNADLIVRAVNSHQALLEAAKQLRDALDYAVTKGNPPECYDSQHENALKKADAAIKAAQPN